MLAGWIDGGADSIEQDALDGWVDSGSIEFLGELSDITVGISNSSVCVLPSYREGTSRFILEAMAMGRGVITSDAPGCRHTVEDNVSGILVAPKDSGALAAAMESLIENRQKVASMAIESRRRAEEKFDVRQVNAQIISALGVAARDPQ